MFLGDALLVFSIQYIIRNYISVIFVVAIVWNTKYNIINRFYENVSSVSII